MTHLRDKRRVLPVLGDRRGGRAGAGGLHARAAPAPGAERERSGTDDHDARRPPRPPPPSSRRASVCSTLGPVEPDPVPTPDQPVDYVAVVETVDGTLQTETFQAVSPADKAAEVGDIERTVGEVVAVEPDGRSRPSSSTTRSTRRRRPGRSGGSTAVGVRGGVGSGPRAGRRDPCGDRRHGGDADHEDLGRAETGGNVAAGVDELLRRSPVTSAPTAERTAPTSPESSGRSTTPSAASAARPGVTIVPVRVLNGSGRDHLRRRRRGSCGRRTQRSGERRRDQPEPGRWCAATRSYEALEYAVDQGVTVVAAAGNCGCSDVALYPGGVLDADRRRHRGRGHHLDRRAGVVLEREQLRDDRRARERDHCRRCRRGTTATASRAAPRWRRRVVAASGRAGQGEVPGVHAGAGAGPPDLHGAGPRAGRMGPVLRGRHRPGRRSRSPPAC